MRRTIPKFSKDGAVKPKLSTETKLFGFSEHEFKTIKDFTAEADRDGNTIAEIKGITPIPDSVKKTVASEAQSPFVAKTGAFAIIRDGGSIAIYADESEGLQNGVMSFLRSLDAERCFSDEIIYDYPDFSLRGVKALMPAREKIEEFKRFIDCMAYFRHNTLMLEIGGAMEYKRHPEINEGWVEYCDFMSEYSGKTIKIQEQTFPWRKNSIHCNNGGGKFLTQDEVRDIIDYCRERNISVIPEVPSTSHCDYMLTRHPELAERSEDPYPDTFCPSNPASYELLFDIFDEVIDVFKPRMINIGHDEYYSINICDRCRRRLMLNEDILAEDINKIHAYLANKGVKTMLWCDKFMNVNEEQGFGGALSYIYFEWDPTKDLLAVLRPTWRAKYKVPRDIICLNWYHSFGEKYDAETKDFPTVLGNFNGQSGYRKKRISENIFGGIASNWGAPTDVYFRRNNILCGMAYNDVLYWDKNYNDDDDEQYGKRIMLIFDTLKTYRYRCDLNKKGRLIEITHRTNMNVPYQSFVDGVFPDGGEFRKKYLAGQYTIEYKDGTASHHDIFYGDNIVNENTPWCAGKCECSAATADAPGAKQVRINATLSSTAGEVTPIYENGRLFCKIFIRNPYPCKEIKDISFCLPDGAEHTVTVESIKIL